MSKRTMPDVWRMRFKALPWLAAGWLSVAFVIFGSHKGPGFFRWIFGFYLPLSMALLIIGSWLWDDAKKRRERNGMKLSHPHPDSN